MNPDYRLSAQAEDDLRRILDRITADSGVERGESVLITIRGRIERMIVFPKAGRRRFDISSTVPIRFWCVERFLIIYRTDRDPVLVMRVVHGAMDLGNLRRSTRIDFDATGDEVRERPTHAYETVHASSHAPSARRRARLHFVLCIALAVHRARRVRYRGGFVERSDAKRRGFNSNVMRGVDPAFTSTQRGAGTSKSGGGTSETHHVPT